MKNKVKTKKIIAYIIMLLLVPLIAVVSFFAASGSTWLWICAAVAVVSCVPFFVVFEKGKTGTAKLTVIAVMTAFAVAGRLIFSELPSFKPVAAIIIITAMYFGSETGFMTGALAAVLSNIYFGQGPWTAFQMFAWGFVGFAAGVLSKPLKKHLWAQLIYGAAAGFVYSAVMDIYTVLWIDKSFNLLRFFAIAATSLPATLTYAASNVVFLLVLSRFIGSKLSRIKIKYGIDEDGNTEI